MTQTQAHNIQQVFKIKLSEKKYTEDSGKS